MKQYEKTRLNRHISHAKGVLAALGVSAGDGALESLPATGKEALRAGYDAWISESRLNLQKLSEFVRERGNAGKRLRGFLPVLTSGVTDTPFAVLHNKGSVKAMAAAIRGAFTPDEYAAFRKAGGRWGVLCPQGRFDLFSQLFLALKQPFGQNKRALFYINRPMSALVKDINEANPSALLGYPSILHLMAKEAREGRLKMKPALLLCWGELLCADARRELEDAFRCPVRDVYASAEGGIMAVACAKGHLHPASGCILEAEENGGLLVTNANNSVAPIVRYRTGDRAEFHADCPCGKGEWLCLLGRQEDIPLLETRAGKVSVDPAKLTRAMDAVEGITRWQMIQSDARTLALHVECAPENRVALFKQAMAGVLSVLAEYGAGDARIALGGEPPAPHRRSGKYRAITGGGK